MPTGADIGHLQAQWCEGAKDRHEEQLHAIRVEGIPYCDLGSVHPASGLPGGSDPEDKIDPAVGGTRSHSRSESGDSNAVEAWREEEIPESTRKKGKNKR